MFFRVLLITPLCIVTKTMYLLVRLKDDIQEGNGLHFENRNGTAGDEEEEPLGGDVASSRQFGTNVWSEMECIIL